MTKKKLSKKYHSVAKTTTDVQPYISPTRNEILDCLQHEQAFQIIISSLGNRKDADKIFVSAVLKSLRFWKWVLIAVASLTIIISGLFSYLFLHHPDKAIHFAEKAVNAQIPDLLPLPCSPQLKSE